MVVLIQDISSGYHKVDVRDCSFICYVHILICNCYYFPGYARLTCSCLVERLTWIFLIFSTYNILQVLKRRKYGGVNTRVGAMGSSWGHFVPFLLEKGVNIAST